MKDKELKKRVVDFWDNKAPEYYAHLSIDEQAQYKIWDRMLKDFELEDKTIIDYGAGGGWLGKFLFKFKNIAKYIAYDISQRSLNFIKNNLKNENIQLFLTTRPFTFKGKFADLLVSIATIQHMPNEEMLIDFLTKVNKSQVPNVLLQFKHSDKTTFNDTYDTIELVKNACLTNSDYVSDKLTEYVLVKEQKIKSSRTNTTYSWCYFKQK